MLSINERCANASKRAAAAEHQQRVEQKAAREKQKRTDQRRNYIIGEMVCRYFPEVMRFEPGTQPQNEERFLSLKAFLIELADDQALIAQIKERARYWQQPGVILEPGEPQCVSGHEVNQA